MSVDIASSRSAAPGRVLVTGSSGFVGSHIVETLSEAGYRVIGLDRSPPAASAQPHAFWECDVTDGDALTTLIREVAPAAVVHAAAITPGHDEPRRARDMVAVNLTSTLTVLLAAAGVGCERVVYLSSAGVYADPQPGQALCENSPLADGGSLYAQSKLASERLCRWASRELGLSTTSLRVGPVYGEYERPTSSRSRMSPIFRAIELALSGAAIRCNAPDTSYDWIHGSDVARAIATILHATPTAAVYNVAGAPVTLAATVDVICACMPSTARSWFATEGQVNLVVPDESRPLSTDLIRSELGFQPVLDLRSGVARTLSARQKRDG